MGRSSFSQSMLFTKCPKTWYWKYIKKVPFVDDYSYANAGNAVHDALEIYYKNGKNRELARQKFEQTWDKYKLNNSKLSEEKPDYWEMVINGIELDINSTDLELLIQFDDTKAFLDIVNKNLPQIDDWKTSKRNEYSKDKELEYEKQIIFYNWLYYRKYGVISEKGNIYYLRYKGNLGIQEVEITMEKINEVAKWYKETLNKMDYYIQNPDEIPDFNTEYYFCPYKDHWGMDELHKSNTLKFSLILEKNRVRLEGNIPELLERGIKKKFSYELKNSFWIKKKYPSMNTTIRFYNPKNKSLPIGFKKDLKKILEIFAKHKKKELKIEEVDMREFDYDTLNLPDKLLSHKILRDYQERAVNIFLNEKMGVLELATGSGKTLLAAEIIRKLGFKTLFLVDKVELLKQTKKVLEDNLGVKIGMIGEGVSDIQPITVGTIQTISKNVKKYEDYLKTIRVLICDETHKVAASTYRTVASKCHGTEFRLGMSGTSFREDGNDMQIFAITGPIINRINAEELIKQGHLMKPEIFFITNYQTQEQIQQLEQELQQGLINETQDYSYYYNCFITHNKHRNNKVIDLVEQLQGKKILILTKLVKHGEILNEKISGSKHLYGETNKEERKQIFEDFINGKINVLISTISIFSEGINIPSLDVVINVSGNKSDVKTIQVLGRVLRKLIGKNKAYYIDFYDDVKYLNKASVDRKNILVKQGHTVSLQNNL